MTVEQEIQLHAHIKAHQASLGCAELKRRARLVREAVALMGRLTKRAAEFSRVDLAEFRRSIDALRNAGRRTERREMAYYGG